MTRSPSTGASWMDPGMTVHSHTVPWPQPNLLAFLRRGAGLRRFFWENPGSPLAFAGFGVAAAIHGHAAQRFQDVRTAAAALFARICNAASQDVPEEVLRPRIMGGFAFRAGPERMADPPQNVWSHFPNGLFFLPRYLLSRLDGRSYLTVSAVAPPDEEWAAQELLWELPAPLDVPVLEGPLVEASVRELVPASTWRTMVRLAVETIRRGQAEKIVLARAREIPLGAHPLAALARLSALYPSCYRFLFEPSAGRAFFGATPELLASRRGAAVHTMALAGSSGRGATLEEDEALGTQLRASRKDVWEHRLVLNEIAARLEPLLSDLHFGETDLLRLSNIQHLCTRITGTAGGASELLDIVETLHPTPAVGGLPTGESLSFITTNEPVARGWYASPVGWMDGRGDGEFIVALRSAVTDGLRTRMYAGAGIVAGSDPLLEWRETEWKFHPMMEALGCR